jgi:hypothetical protein
VVTCGIVLGLTATPWLLARPWVVSAWVALAVSVPVVLEALGLFEPTWWIDGDSIRIRSAVLHASRTIETVALVAVHVVFISIVGRFARVTSRDRRAAERRLHIQAWHLRQLLPSKAPAAS